MSATYLCHRKQLELQIPNNDTDLISFQFRSFLLKFKKYSPQLGVINTNINKKNASFPVFELDKNQIQNIPKHSRCKAIKLQGHLYWGVEP